jgi:hypothetical protein
MFLRLEFDSETARVPECLLQLLHDVTLLDREVNGFRSRVPFHIEQMLFKAAEFERPMPYAPEWYAIYEQARKVFERAATDGVSPRADTREALLRVAQFVRENADLALEPALHSRASLAVKKFHVLAASYEAKLSLRSRSG